MFEDLSEQKKFLDDFGIPQEQFAKAMVSWGILSNIAKDYSSNYKNFERVAKSIDNKFHDCKDVHASNYRVKELDHLIEKIIRKNPKRIKDGTCITVDNYKREITDIIGIRIVLLYKTQWKKVHDFIMENYGGQLHEEPFACAVNGDVLTDFQEKKVRIELRESYRSVHYVIESNGYCIEIQVRTLAEEVWGEIDHNIRYPYNRNDAMLTKYMSLMSYMTSNIDKMALFVCEYLNKFKDPKAPLSNNEVYSQVLSEVEKIEGNAEIKDRLKEIIMSADDYQQIIDPLSLINDVIGN